MLPDGRPSKRLLRMGGSVCAACLAWSCTLSVHTSPPRRYRLIIGAQMPHSFEQVHNHNLGSVTLNYPCPVSRLRVVSHNRTKHREAGTVSRITFLSIIPMQVYNTTFRPHMGTGPPMRAWGPAVDICNIDGGRSWIQRQHLLEGPPSRFFTLMVGTPGSSLAYLGQYLTVPTYLM
jgi:hypothetical protein